MSLLAQDERLTRRVGAVAIVVLLAAIAFFVFVYDKIELGGRVQLAVCFQETGGLREGADVIVAGQPFGHVETIGLSPRGGACRDAGVLVTLAMSRDNAERVTAGGDVFIAARGVLGERYVELGPSPQPWGSPTLATVRTDDPIRGSDPPSIDRVLQRTWNNLVTAQEFAAAVRPEREALQAQLAETARTLEGLVPAIADVGPLRDEASALLDELRRVRDVGLGGEAGRDKLDQVIELSQQTIARLRRVIDELGTQARVLADGGGELRARLGTKGAQGLAAVQLTIDRVRAALDKADLLLAKVRDINARIARGEGSLGRLASDPEFPEDAKELGKILKRQPWKIFDKPAEK